MMIDVKLSPRLGTIANRIPSGSAVADIGTDHGRLPLYLVAQGISPFVVASDRIKMPIAALKSQVTALDWADKISVRLGDGLTVVSPGEAETIVLSGMGGMTMIDILEQSPQVLEKAHCLILQPQRSIPVVRRWLASHHWRITEEDLALDDGRYYEILCAEPGEMFLTEREAMFGAILLKEKPPLLRGYLLSRKEEAERLLRQLEGDGHPTPLAIEKINEIKTNIDEIEEVITWL